MAQNISLISRYINGSDEALAEFYVLVKANLLFTAYHFCRDKETCRDIVQEVFEKLLNLPAEKRNDYFGNENGDIEAWLYVAIKNKCLDNIKIKSNREKITLSVRQLFSIQTSNQSFERFCQEGFRHILKQLQPREQEIIQLHIDGFSNEEIATRLDITYSTVKNNIYEAKKKIKSLWNLFMK